MMSITGSVNVMVVLGVVLAAAACGRGDSGTADRSENPPCPQPFAIGSTCAVENLVCTPPPECRPCVGGFKLVPIPAWYACFCHAGQWDCLPPSSMMGDCFVEEPLSCKNARDVYLDPACTEPAPCSP